MEVINNNQIAEMYHKLGVSIAVFDREMNMIYMNEKAQEFYEKMFGAKDILGKNVKDCHSNLNVRNIEGLFKQFEKGKPFSFISAKVPIFEGGHLTVLHLPIKEDNKIIGIMEIPMGSSFVPGSGYCEYERPIDDDDDNFLDYSHMEK